MTFWLYDATKLDTINLKKISFNDLVYFIFLTSENNKNMMASDDKNKTIKQANQIVPSR